LYLSQKSELSLVNVLSALLACCMELATYRPTPADDYQH
jgi:hypothetical protein